MSDVYLQRFSKLENAKSSVKITSISDKKREVAYRSVRDFSRLLRAGKLEEESVSNKIAMLVLDLRNFAGTQDHLAGHWKQTVEDFKSLFDFTKSYADEETNTSLIKLIDSLRTLSEDGDSAYSTGLREVLKVGTIELLVVPKSWQVFQIEGFLKDFDVNLVRVIHESSFFSTAIRPYDSVLFLTPPNRMRQHHLRNLFFGGAANDFEFLSPSWQLDKNPHRVIDRLFPENMSFRKIVFEIVGGLSESPILDDDIEFISAPSSLENVPLFNASGDVQCRLIELSDNFVYPVELGAFRVSVLAENKEGGIEVQYLDPFAELSPGDIVFELKSGVDEDFLMESVQSDLGFEYMEFSDIHSRWKNQIRTKLQFDTYDAIEADLAQSGIRAAHQLKSWIENPGFISPRLNEDWKKLLEFCGFSNQELTRALELTTSIRASLIHYGLSARKLMSEEISSQELDRVSQGEVILKSLPDFGDAVFAIATVTSVPSEVFSCQQSQIRTLMRKSND